MPFPRVSEHIGESRFAFIERLCRMLNMHLIDDGVGGLVAFRGVGDTGLVIREGANLQRGRVLLKNSDHVDDIVVRGHDAGSDSADVNRSPEGRSKVDPPINRPFKIIAEEMGHSRFMQRRADQQADWDKFMQEDGDATVPGWFTPDGSLWWYHVPSKIILYSPSLLPNDLYGFAVKAVTHRQSVEGGTTTDVMLCRHDGFGPGVGPNIEFTKPKT